MKTRAEIKEKMIEIAYKTWFNILGAGLGLTGSLLYIAFIMRPYLTFTLYLVVVFFILLNSIAFVFFLFCSITEWMESRMTEFPNKSDKEEKWNG